MALSYNQNMSRVRLNDNFFSVNIEAQLLELLNKNMHLTEVSLAGNRLSLGCLAKIKQINQRNIKLIEEKEPDRLKAELYRLRYENEKLQKAQKDVDAKENEVRFLTVEKN